MSDGPAAVLVNSSGSEVGTSGNPLRTEPAGSTSQPITATTLPLPTGAATSAKQPALGTAGSPSADVLSVQGVSGGTPQPVSGTVTANAGTGPFPVSDNGGSLTVDGSVTATQATGTNLHAVVDSGSITATQATGTNLHAVVDSGSITATQATGTNLHAVVDAATIAALTDGTQKAIVRGGAKGATVAADVTSTAEGTDHQALDVQIMHGGAAKDPTQVRALTSSDTVTAVQSTASSLKTQVDGQGTAGSPVGGVVSIQGVGSGTPVPVSGTITATNPSVGTDNAAKPTSDTLIGGSDGTNVQAARIFDADSGGGTQYVLGVQLRKAASGGSVELGTSGDPVRTDPTGTTAQPVTDGGGSLTVDGAVTANIGTSGSLALDATLTGGTQKAIVRGGAKGTTTAADVTSTAEGTDHQALDVQIMHGGAAKDPTQVRALTSSDTVTAVSATAANLKTQVDGQGTAGSPVGGVVSVQGVGGGTPQPVSGTVTANAGTGPFPVSDNGGSLTVDGTVTATQGTAAALSGGWPVKVTDGTNSQPTMDTAARSGYQRVTDGTNTAAVKAASTAAVATDTALVVAVSPNNTPVLPTGAATFAAQTTGNNSLSSIDTKTPALGQATMAASSPVVIASNQTAVPVSGTVTATNPSVGTDNAAKPTSDTLIGGSDGTNVQALRAFDADSGGGTQYVLGVQLRKSASGGSVETGTATNPLFNTMNQNVVGSTLNSSTANLAAGASFSGTSESTLGIAGIQVNCKASQPIGVSVQQSPDGTNWDVVDDQTFLADEGEGRTFQATASFFRVVATNIGNAATTYFRFQTALCPVVEVVPRALTPQGRLRLASQTVSWAPDPSNYSDRTQNRALLMDVDRNLNVRARCLTDESSFRDDFTVGELYTDIAGTVYFTNGSTVVTGVGTSFTTELDVLRYLKLSTHADSAYDGVGEIKSDIYLELAEPYTGATGSGTGRSSFWRYNIETGGAITQTGSEILLASGTTSGTNVQAKRAGDYPPYVIGFKARITQRIVNQEAHVGLADGDIGTVENQALVVFTGATSTTAILRTSSSSADVEQTTFTLPDGAVSSTSLYYQLEVTSNKVSLFVNDVRVAEHKLHIPSPYAVMDCHCCIKNTGVAASSTTLACDTYFLTNFDRVEVSTNPRGDALATKEMRSSSPVCTNVAAAVADTALLAPNPNRLGCSIYNDSVATLYLKLGSGASVTSFSIALGRYDYYEAPANYVGRINGYWSAATGSARVTELS